MLKGLICLDTLYNYFLHLCNNAFIFVDVSACLMNAIDVGLGYSSYFTFNICYMFSVKAIPFETFRAVVSFAAGWPNQTSADNPLVTFQME